MMIEIDITCPVCSSKKSQSIPEELISELDKQGKEIDLILIPENALCPHLFLVEIDRDFKTVQTYSMDEIIATKEMEADEEIKAFMQSVENIDYEGTIEELLTRWCGTRSIQKEIVEDKLQNIMYLYKDLVSGISQIIKDEIYFLLEEFSDKYNAILKQNLKNLRLGIPPKVVDKMIERLYRNGFEILGEFYGVQITFIEHPFVEALRELSESDNDNLQNICIDVNSRLADTVKEQFSLLKRQLKDIQYKIYKSLEKFQLEVIPKSTDLTINNIFSKSLINISEKLKSWSNEWVV